ncbi:MAG: hypothetical protein SF123_09605 [Chloroflexota bacterium]|nr:hypothetical protein [Chloroflexota bacterium]
MASNLERVGVQYVAEGVAKFLQSAQQTRAANEAQARALDALSKAAQRTRQDFQEQNRANEKAAEAARKAAQAAEQQAAAAQKAAAAQSGAGRATQMLAGGMNFLKNAVGGVVQMLGTALMAAIGVVVAGLALLAAGTVAAVAGLVKLAERGAALPGIAQSFDVLTASVGMASSAMLNELRAAAGGVISDFELMKQTNFALAGATGEFATQFGQALPQLLAIARAQARATGQDFDYMFESLILGIKRSSPLIIDNLGFVLSESEAYQTYADSVGKTVEQLTAEEKQIAVLNAVLASGQTALDMYGNLQETAAEKAARFNTTLTNIFDQLGVMVQPIYSAVLDALNGLLNGIAGFISQAAPYIGAIIQLVGEMLAPILGGIANAGQQLNSPGAAQSFFTGAANTFGSFARGILDIANNYIFPTVISIAEFIADFLLGESPPPKGPLSAIDKGGRNVMAAWLQGFEGASLEPVNTVAANVAAAMGNIAAMSTAQVDARLRQLDMAIQPFNAQLEIAKSRFEAISAPAEAALRAIDRQMQTALAAMEAGDEQAAATVRALEAQRAAVQGAMDAQQQQMDYAQIQLALAQAQQSEERALLGIQQDRLKLFDDGTQAVTESGGGAAKEPKAKAGKAEPPQAAGGGASMPTMPAGNVLADMFGSAEQVAGARGELNAAFQAGLGDSAQQLQANVGRLQTQTGRIQQGLTGLPTRVGDAFSNVKTTIEARLTEARDAVTSLIDGITNPDTEGSIPNRFNAIAGHVGAALTTAKDEAVARFNEIVVAAGTFASSILDPAVAGSIPHWFASLPDRVSAELGRINPVTQEKFDELRATIDTAIDSVFNPEVATSIPARFAALPGQIQTALSGIGATVTDFFVTPVADALGVSVDNILNPDVEGSIPSRFAALQGSIQTALAPIENEVRNTFVTPLQNLFATDLGNWFNPEVPTSVPAMFAGLGARISAAAAPVIATVTDTFITPLANALGINLDALLNPELETSIPYKFGQLGTWITEAVSGLPETVTTNLITPIGGVIRQFFNGEGEGSLPYIIAQAIDLFFNLPTRIQEALAGIGTALYTALAQPAIDVLNGVIGMFETFVNSIRTAIADFIGGVADSLANVPLPGVGDIAAQLGGTAAELRTPLTFGRVTGVVPGAARGGLFGKGMLKVGERGEEYIMNASSKLAVFPNQMLRAMDSMSQMLAQPAPMLMPSSTTYNDSHDMNVNFNGGAGNPADVMRRLSLMRAYGR